MSNKFNSNPKLFECIGRLKATKKAKKETLLLFSKYQISPENIKEKKGQFKGSSQDFETVLETKKG